MFSTLLHTVNETSSFHHKVAKRLIAPPLMMDQQLLKYSSVLTMLFGQITKSETLH